MKDKILEYIEDWKAKGYPEDIPDECPERLAALCLAPSYKAICYAILRNDVALKSLGFTPRMSPVYRAIKKIEIEARNAPSH